MAKNKSIRVIQTNLHDHPAVLAWRELNPLPIELDRIEILKGKVRNQNRNYKKIVCRLVVKDSMGDSIIAKRFKRANALVENAVYTEILPNLPISSLQYHGMVEESDGEICWIFMEDTSGYESSSLNGGHSQLFAKWLAQMHTSANHFGVTAILPVKGHIHYLKRLKLVRTSLREDIDSLAHQAYDLAPLEIILHQFDLLQSKWNLVKECCAEIPWTLVHGDFVARNIHVRSTRAGLSVLPFDWGEAGLGTPVIDFMHVDLDGYWSVARDHWPWLDVHTLQRLAIVGRIFRCLDSIYWELPGLKCKRLTYPLVNMNIYKERLADAIHEAGLSHTYESIG